MDLYKAEHLELIADPEHELDGRNIATFLSLLYPIFFPSTPYVLCIKLHTYEAPVERM